MLRRDTPWWRIEVWFDDDTHRVVTFDPSRVTGKKQFLIDTKKNYRLLPRYRYPVVLFEPDDLQLLSGSPARRRRFIDRLISQIDIHYSSYLSKYERALKQRNNLLKKPSVSLDELFVWDMAISEYGAYVIEQRVNFIEKLNSHLAPTYQDIARVDDDISVHYSHTLIGNTKQKLLNELHARSQKDMILGYTSVGPHRHDVEFYFNGSPALSVASRGEVRSLLLSLKFIEVRLIEDLAGLTPVVLLDDVFSELDVSRQEKLVDINHAQVVITSVEYSRHNGTIVTLQ
jgi:DNA replication and repair protein RecF